ncbi:MAG TPA: GDP-fucose synthetase [Holosporales bacterium]|nr:GDP-fucose synthetase [Holosporales bacterium]
MMFSLENQKVFVAGHRGMVGQGLVRALKKEKCEILTETRDVLDLCNQQDVDAWFAKKKPDVVFLAAAKVGGILANSKYPADFLFDNLKIEQNVIQAAQKYGVKKLLFLGSSCIYPKMAPQPIKEKSLLTGPLEETNQWYAIAKIAGLKMIEACRIQHGCDFISVMPTNLYGPGDTYHLENSHVIPSLILKFHEAKKSNAPFVTLWGTGAPRREFLHVDDLSSACICVIKKYSAGEPINIGVGEDMTILELAHSIAKVVDYHGEIRFDTSMPDGTPRKVLDVSRLTDLGLKSSIRFTEGLKQTYADFAKE